MFDNRLKNLREEKGLTQKEAASKLEIAHRTYSSYENNEREPNSETLIKLADFFECSIDYLVGRTETKSVNPDIQIACKVTGLSEKAIKALINQKVKENEISLLNGIKVTNIILEDEYNVNETINSFINTIGLSDKNDLDENIKKIVDSKNNISLLDTIESFFSIPENKSQNFYISKSGKLINRLSVNGNPDIQSFLDIINVGDIDINEITTQVILNKINSKLIAIKANLKKGKTNLDENI